MRIFRTFARSWEFTKLSYSIVWNHKNLLIFPILTTIAAALVVASFVLPLWGTGTLEQWEKVIEQSGVVGPNNIIMWITLFLFYFCNYFVIVFFNSALMACGMQVISGEPPKIGYGLSMASKRLPQIVGWALLSALIGILLRALESHDRVGGIVAAIFGTAWSALTFFVVPVIVMEGEGPFTAIKRSFSTLKETWGTAVVCNFSLGIINLLITLPAILIGVVIMHYGVYSRSLLVLSICIGITGFLIVMSVAFTSTADAMFKAILYHYATGKMIPEGIDTNSLDEAFLSKK